MHTADRLLHALIQALGIALKLTAQGKGQLWHVETVYCVVVRFSR